MAAQRFCISSLYLYESPLLRDHIEQLRAPKLISSANDFQVLASLTTHAVAINTETLRGFLLCEKRRGYLARSNKFGVLASAPGFFDLRDCRFDCTFISVPDGK